jgi:cobalamin biosynthesis protein CobT
MCRNFPGRLRTGILINRQRMGEQSISITEMQDRQMGELSILMNLLIQYCFQGTVNNVDGYQGPLLDVLNGCIPYIDDSKLTEDPRIRFDAVNHILLKLWDYLAPLIEEARKNPPEEILERISEQLQETSNDPNGSGRPVGYFAPKEKNDPNSRFDVNGVGEQDGDRIALTKTDDPEAETGGSVTFDQNYGGAGYEECGKDIDRLLSSVAEDRVNMRMEQELSEELQAEANHIHYGNAHLGIHVTVNRMSVVPEYLAQEYSRVSAPLLLLSKRMQKQVLQVLKDRRQGGKQNGLLMGRRLEARSLVRNDGRYFYKNNLPQDKAELAVSLLVDESGSMGCLDRITTARAASIVIYDFCKRLRIPVMIMGHTASGKQVELFSYADFDSIDGKDCYRMMDMSARGCNRDGAALRYVAEQLVKRPEQHKLLILISDGQPNDDGYTGTGAEADLRGIRREYTNKGVTLFAAAIGDDRENIERIYQEGYLDITDLNQLPQNLAKLIARYVRAA